ncbi:MAG TPA: xanthine dehydrogenase family protein molybdopterin-binding subunit [Burkholderiales bacterium]|nr:xanthine dehydrogenase family protein molybdopterin-binding subunit [Burkholderiales bacterium]
MGAWVGQPLRRREDPALLTGKARYLGDLTRPGMVHAAFVRSPHAHARIRSIDTAEARRLPGVHAVLTGADLPADLGAMPSMLAFEEHRPTPTWALARGRVRYVGEPAALVVADSPYIAEDALELVRVDWEPLPAVASIEAALAPGAPRLYDDWPDNVAARFETAIGDAERALAEADVRLAETFSIQRNFACPLETRGVLAEWDAHRDELVLTTSSQSMHQVRDYLAAMLRLPTHRVRVIVPQVGGGFGGKFHFYAEEAAVALAARAVRRPVRWVEDRLESFVATVHAREQRLEVKLGARRDGTITAITADIAGDLGSMHHTCSMGPVWLTAVMMTNVYRIPNARVRARAVATNKTPLGSYRGWGQPQANFAVERMVDVLAKKLSLDPAEVRRRNFIPPEAFPYTGIFHTFDSGRYAECLDRALATFDYAGWRRRQAEARESGRSVGIGMSFHVENTALGPSRGLNQGGCTQGGYDIARIRMEPSGEVTVYTGLCEMGQGFTNGLAQVCADALGVDRDAVHVVTGDTQVCPYTGYGTGASRSAAVGGASVRKAAGRLRKKIAHIASHMLEASPGDLEFADGRVSIVGVPGRAVTMGQIAEAAYRQVVRLPEDTEPGLEAVAAFDPTAMAWPYGVNLAAVEVDTRLGEVKFLDYVMVHDSGTLLNPLIVEGQIHGGVAQGIAQALYEELAYDEHGQLLTGSFMDFLVPSAAEIPRLRLDHTVTPSPVIPGGTKGVGEGGIIGPMAAVANAISDAVGHEFNELPVNPERILSALRARRSAR